MLKELQIEMEKLASFSNHKGYFYKVSDILIVTMMGLLCGITDTKGIHQWSSVPHVMDFFKKEFKIERLPKQSHFYNLLYCVNYEQFIASFERWVQFTIQEPVGGKTIAIDGKSIRSSGKLSKDNKMLHIASAVIADTGMIISSKECEYAKSSEVGVFREIVKSLKVEGAVIVGDALHCKPKSAEVVVNAGGYYLFTVKDNNKKLKESIEIHSKNRHTDTAHTLDKNAGRIETRTAYVCENIELLHNKEKWKDVSCVGAIHRKVEKKGKIYEEWHYYISNKPLTAKELLHHARLEWQVESMHWLLDVHFKEDETKIRDMEVQKNLNLMRKIVINIVKQYQSSLPKPLAMSHILRQNLFDINQLNRFITHFRQ